MFFVFFCDLVMEKMGFEPMVQEKLHVDLANQCLKPLSHFSIYYIIDQTIPRKKTDDNPKIAIIYVYI